MEVHGGFVPEGVGSMPTVEVTAPTAPLLFFSVETEPSNRSFVGDADGHVYKLSSWHYSGQSPLPGCGDIVHRYLPPVGHFVSLMFILLCF